MAYILGVGPLSSRSAFLTNSAFPSVDIGFTVPSDEEMKSKAMTGYGVFTLFL